MHGVTRSAGIHLPSDFASAVHFAEGFFMAQTMRSARATAAISAWAPGIANHMSVKPRICLHFDLSRIWSHGGKAGDHVLYKQRRKGGKDARRIMKCNIRSAELFLTSTLFASCPLRLCVNYYGSSQMLSRPFLLRLSAGNNANAGQPTLPPALR